MVGVQFGEFRHHKYTKEPIRLTAPALDSGKGGQLLRQPTVIEIGNNVPKELLYGTDSELVPELPRKAMRTALWHYKEGRYEDAVVRCRVTMEAILSDQGIPEGLPSAMVDKAAEDSLLPKPYERLCEVITAFGGKAAHLNPPVHQGEALVIIGIVAGLIRFFYHDEGVDSEEAT